MGAATGGGSARRPLASARAGARHAWSAALAVLAALRYTAPVWLPCLFFAQIALLGLHPALAERARLADAHTVLEQRLEAEREVRDDLVRALRAHKDPIYVARRERNRLDPNAGAGSSTRQR